MPDASQPEIIPEDEVTIEKWPLGYNPRGHFSSAEEEIKDYFCGDDATRDGARALARQYRVNGGGKGDAENGSTNPPPVGVKEVRFPLPGKPDVRIWLPVDLNEAEWGMLDTYLRMFISLSKPST